MNFYSFHIGDFRAGTINLGRLARWIYRDMLDMYYDTEKPLPADEELLCDALGIETEEERKALDRVLRLKFIQSEDGYHHEVCDRVILDYQSKAETARNNGRLGGRPKNPELTNRVTKSVPTGNPDLTGLKANQEPITINQEPKTPTVSTSGKPKSRAKASKKVPEHFVVSDSLKAWAAEGAPLVDWRKETEKFRDWEFKHARSDWDATWRTWMRNAQQSLEEKGVTSNRRDEVIV